MNKVKYAEKVRAVRDTIIDSIQELSVDKENLLPNIKVIKELTSVLKEMDRIEERDDTSVEEGSREELLSFYDDIKSRTVINGQTKRKRR